MEMPKSSSSATRVALLGLIGTLLTVCGGLLGAALSAAMTIYQTERQAQQVALPAPGSEQTLRIDTQRIAISYEEAVNLNPGEHYIAPELGFVCAQPRAGWNALEEMTYRDLFVERGAWTGSTWDEQAVRRIRYGEPIKVQYLEGSEINGQEVDLELARLAYHTDTFHFSNEITILAADKAIAANYASLAAVALEWGAIYRSGASRIIANERSDYILMQTSWRMQNVRINGQDGDLSVERWALFAEGPRHYYVVEVVYLPLTGQPMQVWDDLQYYMDSFRVIQ